ncbi:MAG: ankyrin repeat domain-containing protein [Desulfomonilaceae bacterium]
MMCKPRIPIIVIGLMFVATLFSSASYGRINWALMEAICRNDLNQVQKVLDLGANVNSRDDRGETALMVACFEGHAEIVGLLLKRGADVNAKTKYGYTALQAASANGHTEIVDLLKGHGAKE